MPDSCPVVPRLRGPGGRPLRVAHLTTVDMSLALLLGTELSIDVETGLETFGLSAPGAFVSEVEARGVTHLPQPALTRSWDPVQDVRAVGHLRATLRSLRPDVLHTHNPKTGVIGRLVGRAVGVPVVVNTCHGLWLTPEDSRRRRAVVLTAEAVAAGASHAELYQNADDQALLRRVVPPHRSRLVGNGIDLTRFRRDRAQRAAVRSELGILDGDVLVGAVGRRVAEKGVVEFASVAERLRDRARFVWVGPEDEQPPVPGGDAVTWLGARRDMPAVYSALDIFVLPSYREGFSRSAMEAAACGLPLVLSDIRGCREIGTHGQHLLLVEPRDAKGLGDAVQQLVEDPRLRSDLGAAAAARAGIEFDQVRVAAASLRTYAEVARRRGLPWEVSE